jgi:catechol 2,3-dioxygenase-like lactoylglutathione lyase family enzyme
MIKNGKMPNHTYLHFSIPIKKIKIVANQFIPSQNTDKTKTMNTNPFPRMHVSLYVSDIQQTVKFYTQFFGTQPEKVKSNYAKYILSEPSLIISFVENKDRVQQNFGHLGFQVQSTEELQERLFEAKQQNFAIREEMGTNCCYAKQDKFWVTDPDGVQWEVYYFHEDIEYNDPHYESKEATACCTVSSEETKNSCGCNANVESTIQTKITSCC